MKIPYSLLFYENTSFANLPDGGQVFWYGASKKVVNTEGY